MRFLADIEQRQVLTLSDGELQRTFLMQAIGTIALLMDNIHRIALEPAKGVLTHTNPDQVYGMDVADWMRSLYSR